VIYQTDHQLHPLTFLLWTDQAPSRPSFVDPSITSTILCGPHLKYRTNATVPLTSRTTTISQPAHPTASFIYQPTTWHTYHGKSNWWYESFNNRFDMLPCFTSVIFVSKTYMISVEIISQMWIGQLFLLAIRIYNQGCW